MALIMWDNKFSVEIPEIDAQHRILFDMINQLDKAISAGTANEEAVALLGALSDYAADHFSLEEGYLKQYEYPDLQGHHAEHEQFTAQVMRFDRGLKEGSGVPSSELMMFLKNWLTNHILFSDRKYMSLLKSKLRDQRLP